MKKLKTVLFWIASCTWGLPMTLIGGITAAVLMILGYKPKRFHSLIYIEVGKNWGGINCGAFFFVSQSPTLHIKQHEAGHGIQNIILGWFMPFIVGIPSAARYWYREYLTTSGKKKYSELKPYDAIWFEGWATNLGEKHF